MSLIQESGKETTNNITFSFKGIPYIVLFVLQLLSDIFFITSLI